MGWPAEPIADAVRALTAAALATYPTGDGGAERFDCGAIACQVITTVAANLGGVDALLAGRPGSWEADYLRQIVESTTTPEDLLAYRTEPVRLQLNPEAVLDELGVGALQQQAQDAIEDRDDQAHDAVEARYPDPDARTDEQWDALEAERDALIERAEAEHQALEALWQADVDAYTAAYTQTVRQAAAELGLTVPVEVEVIEDYRAEPYWDELAERLHDVARERTPLPTGVAGLRPGLVVDGSDQGDGDAAGDRR